VGYNSNCRPERVKYKKQAANILGVMKVQQERISTLEKEEAGLKDD
jgi:hypothetical protein